MKRLIERTLSSIGIRKLVKSDGFTLHNLSNWQLADLIDDFLSQTETRYDRDALYEFLDNSDGSCKAIKDELEMIYQSANGEDGFATHNGRYSLSELSSRLRSEELGRLR